MFTEYKTYEILAFLNSIIRAGKSKGYFNIYTEAVEELECRKYKFAYIYKYQLYNSIDDIGDGDGAQ